MSIVNWGTEQVVSSSAIFGQSDPVSVAMHDGGYVIFWDDNRYTGIDADLDVIRGQRYDAGGNPIGSEFVVSSAPSGQQKNPSATTLSNGNFVVVWEDTSSTAADTSGSSIRARLFNSDGVPQGSEFVVNTTTSGDQIQPSVSALSGGGFVVTWNDGSGSGGDTSGTQIRAQVFASTGVKEGSEVEVNTTVANDQFRPVVSGLTGGGFAIAWVDDSLPASSDNLGWNIHTQLFTAQGTAVGPERLVNTSAGYNEGIPGIAALENGGYVVTWSLQRGGTGGLIDLFPKAWFQLFDANGAALGDNIQVHEWLPENGEPTPFRPLLSPTPVALKNGGFLISWDDESLGNVDLRALEFSELGARASEAPALINTTTAGSQLDSNLVLLADGRVVAAFENDGRISAQILDPRDGLVEGTERGETLYGNASYDDFIFASAGDDTLYGLDGSDALDGGTGADAMHGGAGNDVYYVDSIGDTIFDSSGIDCVNSTVSFTLGLDVENLTLAGSNAISGTGHDGSNVIVGNSQSNTLTGRGGNDFLFGDAGSDILVGGRGRDIMSGGSESDVFDFNARAETGKTAATRDRIKDFQHRLDDIDLKDIDARSGVAGNNSFKFIGSTEFHGVKGELRYERVNKPGTTSDKTIVEGDVNGDGSMPVPLAQAGAI